MIIVPAASLGSIREAGWLKRRAAAGAAILIESGGAFISESAFARQQSLALSQFNLHLEQPAPLWERADGSARIPYVDLTWPITARIRDFSRVIVVSGNDAEVIGRIDDRPVAIKQRLGDGMLVFLGSPVGPHILAGDREAQAWLRDLTRTNPI